MSFSWLNEGPVPGNRRDGPTVQYWLRTPFLDPRLSLAAGAGPYTFFNTTTSGKRSIDDHGWGAVLSVAATWYTENRFFYQLRINEILASRSFNSTAVMFGLGYQVDTLDGRGLVGGRSGKSVPSGDELTAFLGRTTVNNRGTPGSFAGGVEYRHGFGQYVDATFTWIDEGHTPINTRQGVAAQA